MKKVLFFTMLLAVASMFTSCENPDKKLVKDLTGTWSGTTIFAEEEVPLVYQFFESADGLTGNFIELTVLSIEDEIDGVDYTIPYYAYVGGTYKVDDGWLSIQYDLETVTIEFDEEDVYEYVAAFLDYDREQGDQQWLDDTPESLTEYFISSRQVSIGEEWTGYCEDFNNSKGDGFKDLTVSESSMSFKANDYNAQFHRAKDMFDNYPFDE